LDPHKKTKEKGALLSILKWRIVTIQKKNL